MKQIYLLIALLGALAFTNCSSDDPKIPSDEQESSSKEEVNYYIKYKVKSAASYQRINSVTITTDKGPTTLEFNNQVSWEETYGPVEKGFKAQISVKGYIGSLEIHCCRGKEPFALKAMINEATSNPTLEYTIDY